MYRRASERQDVLWKTDLHLSREIPGALLVISGFISPKIYLGSLKYLS
jgi:hypothetical protein